MSSIPCRALVDPPRILFVTVDWPTGAVFAVTVERFAHVVAVGSIHDRVRKLAGEPVWPPDPRPDSRGLVRTCAPGSGRPAPGSAASRRLAELGLLPITMQELIERARSALAAHGLPPALPQLWAGE